MTYKAISQAFDQTVQVSKTRCGSLNQLNVRNICKPHKDLNTVVNVVGTIRMIIVTVKASRNIIVLPQLTRMTALTLCDMLLIKQSVTVSDILSQPTI